jgi:hypothetical protein
MDKHIKIMLSSRNNSKFGKKTLSNIRKELKKIIEKEKLFEKNIYEVWINEEEVSSNETWDECIKQARENDIVIVLYNGEAGWVRNEKDKIGICHAEMMAAIESSSEKVYVIDISNGKIGQKDADRKFYNDIQAYRKMGKAKNLTELKSVVKQIVFEATLKLFKKGVKSSKKSQNLGTILEWKKFNYDTRSKKIKQSLKEKFEIINNDLVIYKDNSRKILCKLHALPDSASVSAAKERVGQPFLNDIYESKILKNYDGGVVHFIGCYKNITESQVRKIMGFPDIILIKDEFGIYVADKIYKIQMVFLEKCIDENNTIKQLENFFDWLSRSGENEDFINRAKDRKEIILKIAEKMEK